jgi:hypothetical protein
MENKMREEFENLCWHDNYETGRDGTYIDNVTQVSWLSYQAVRNHPIEVSLEEAVKMVDNLIGD